MDDFIFILGSNWKLSLAELDTCLKSEPFKGKINDYSSNIASVKFDNLAQRKHFVDDLETLQYYLGGTQKIAKIFDFFNILTLKNAFPSRVENFNEIKRERKKIKTILKNSIEKIFEKIENENVFFAVSIYPNLFDDDYYREILVKHFLPFLNKNISKILKEKNANKAIYFKYPEKNIASGNLNPIFPHHVIKYELLKQNRAELVFAITEEGCYIARTFTSDDPNFKRKIDEERPHKDFKSAISPKLAIMMLNFLNIFNDRHQKVILDPFVGNGTIALFALLEDFKIYGSDIDKEKIDHTKRNIQWLQKELEIPPISNLSNRFKTSDIENLSNNFESEYFDGIVTEPNLGPFYKEKPYYTEAMELFENKLEPLYSTIFEQAHNLLKPKCRICIVAPSISLVDDKSDFRMDVQKIAIENNLTPISLISQKRIANKSNERLQFRKQNLYSIMDTKEGQIIKRKIFVFEKT
ncbi:MAG: methyltransferase domain-containing protein [Promethearchaeota archaeon]|nr:MAG: methyltransferase domain-containing protein [Candidatus Lokiarchaeota archaeon]